MLFRSVIILQAVFVGHVMTGVDKPRDMMFLDLVESRLRWGIGGIISVLLVSLSYYFGIIASIGNYMLSNHSEQMERDKDDEKIRKQLKLSKDETERKMWEKETFRFINLYNFTKGFIDGINKDLVEYGSQEDYVQKNRKLFKDRKSTRLNSSHVRTSRMPSSA